MYIKLETRLTHELHRLELFNQIAYRFRTIGPSSMLCKQGSHTFGATLCPTTFAVLAVINQWITWHSRTYLDSYRRHRLILILIACSKHIRVTVNWHVEASQLIHHMVLLSTRAELLYQPELGSGEVQTKFVSFPTLPAFKLKKPSAVGYLCWLSRAEMPRI
jgi:hypothetical protein